MEKASAFYLRFQSLCDEKGRSPTNVVTAAGLSSCLVTAWKNGASPKLETLMCLAEQLGVPVTAFLDGSTSEVPKNGQREEEA